MRIYEYSWESKKDDKETVEIYIDRSVINWLMEAVKVDIKNAVNENDFEKAKEYFKELGILANKTEKLDELEEENESGRGEEEK